LGNVLPIKIAEEYRTLSAPTAESFVVSDAEQLARIRQMEAINEIVEATNEEAKAIAVDIEQQNSELQEQQEQEFQEIEQQEMDLQEAEQQEMEQLEQEIQEIEAQEAEVEAQEQQEQEIEQQEKDIEYDYSYSQ